MSELAGIIIVDGKGVCREFHLADIRKAIGSLYDQVNLCSTMLVYAACSPDNESGLKMLYALDKAQVLALLTAKTRNYKPLTKPDNRQLTVNGGFRG